MVHSERCEDCKGLAARREMRPLHARMLIDRDGPADRYKARQLPTQAIAMYRQIGMPKHAEMTEELLIQT